MLFAKSIGHCVTVMKTLAGIQSKQITCSTAVYCYIYLLIRRVAVSTPDNEAVIAKLVENSLVLLPSSTAVMLKG